MKNSLSAKRKIRIREYGVWYAMIAIPLIGFLVFSLYPILWAVQKAWFFYDGSISTMRYVGFDNFVTLFTKDSTYWTAWFTTFKFAFLKIPFEMVIAMGLALMLHRKLPGSGFFRSIYYMPSVISVAIIGVVFANMFDFFGFINGILMKYNIISENINWFEKAGSSMFVLVTASVWNTFGINVMYFLVALSNIDKELFEAAEIDGSSKARTFFSITLPMMGPVLQTILLLSINGTLLTNDLILVTTGGAPAGKTYSIAAYVTSKFVPGFAEGSVNIGYGAACAIVMAVLMAAIAGIYSKISKKLNNIY